MADGQLIDVGNSEEDSGYPMTFPLNLTSSAAASKDSKKARPNFYSLPNTLSEEDDPFGLLDHIKNVPVDQNREETATGTLINVDITGIKRSESCWSPYVASLSESNSGSTRSSSMHVSNPQLTSPFCSSGDDSRSSNEPNWDQLLTDAQSVIAISNTVSVKTPVASIKSDQMLDFSLCESGALESPLALIDSSQLGQDNFLVTLTPEKSPTTKLAKHFPTSTKVVDLEEELIKATQSLDMNKADSVLNEINKENIKEEAGMINLSKSASKPPADISALKLRLSAIKNANKCSEEIKENENKKQSKPIRPKLINSSSKNIKSVSSESKTAIRTAPLKAKPKANASSQSCPKLNSNESSKLKQTPTTTKSVSSTKSTSSKTNQRATPISAPKSVTSNPSSRNAANEKKTMEMPGIKRLQPPSTPVSSIKKASNQFATPTIRTKSMKPALSSSNRSTSHDSLSSKPASSTKPTPSKLIKPNFSRQGSNLSSQSRGGYAPVPKFLTPQLPNKGQQLKNNSASVTKPQLMHSTPATPRQIKLQPRSLTSPSPIHSNSR